MSSAYIKVPENGMGPGQQPTLTYTTAYVTAPAKIYHATKQMFHKFGTHIIARS